MIRHLPANAGSGEEYKTHQHTLLLKYSGGSPSTKLGNRNRHSECISIFPAVYRLTDTGKLLKACSLVILNTRMETQHYKYTMISI